MDIEPISPRIGARVRVDPSLLCHADVVRRCLELLEECCVLVFPQVGLSDQEQLAFTDQLGTRVNFWRDVPGGNATEQDVYKLTLDPLVNDRPEFVQASFFWHMDGLTADSPVPKATVLSARRISLKGGQTDFANTYAAYETLPEEEKAEIAELRAMHSPAAGFRLIVGSLPEDKPAPQSGHYSAREHPIVCTHADGRKSLVIGNSADYIVGMPIPDGRALLARLVEWTAQPVFRYRHQWEVGDLVVWNNRATLHRVIPYDVQSGRVMHRTVVS
jgi:alpha-ketoglutarate-dependent taurine dioxygenase